MSENHPSENPYASPCGDTDVPGLPIPRESPRLLAWLACVPHGVAILMSLAFFLAAASGYRAPDRIAMPYSMVFTAFHMGSWLLFLIWTYQAAACARAIDPANALPPRRAVGSYFLPLFNLVMPYQAMSRIARIALAPSGHAHVVAWWMIVVLTYIAPVYVAVIDAFMHHEDAGFTANYVQSTAYLVLRTLDAILGIALVIRITKGLERESQAQQEISIPLTPDAR